MAPLTLLLIALLAAPAVSDTSMIFSGKVICQLDKQFSYSIEVREEDTFKDDILFTGERQFKQLHSAAYNISTSDDSDGIFDHNFEIVFELIHDCTKNGHLYFYHLFVVQIPISDSTVYHSLDFDITDKGISLSELEGPMILSD